MSVQLNFNAQTVEPTQSLDAVPADNYKMQLTSTEVKETSAGGNHMLKCVFEIMEGEYKGRKVFENLNLWHSNAVASEIAWRKLSALCHATGVLQLQDTGQLHNIPVMGNVKVENDAEYGKQNRVAGFTAIAGAAAPGGPAQAPQAAPPAPAQAQAPAPAAAPQAAPAPAPAPQQAPAPAAAPPQPAAGGTPPWMQGQAQAQPGQPAADPGTPPWAR